MHKRLLLAVFIVIYSVGCSVSEETASQPPKPQSSLPPVSEVIKKPLPPEKAGELAGKVGENWLYGQGVGETALAAGAIYVFPPYAVYVLGNAALSACGYEEIRVTDALPEEPREEYNSVYDSVTSAPGQAASTVAGTEFRTKEQIRKDYEEFLRDANSQEASKDKKGNHSPSRTGPETGPRRS